MNGALCSRARLGIERLEARRLLSGISIGTPPTPPYATIVSNSQLHVGAPDSDDTIDIARVVNDDSSVSLLVTLNEHVWTFDAAPIVWIRVDAGAGNDTITVGQDITVPSRLLGEDGNDSIRAGGGDDVLVAGLGNDTLFGGAGHTTLDYSARTDPLTILRHQVTANSGAEIDSIDGPFQSFLSGSGNDTVPGAYMSYGETAWTHFDGGAGDDIIQFTGSSDMTVHGGAGNDQITIHSWKHTVHYFGDTGDDTFYVYRSSATARHYHGGEGFDTLDWRAFNNEWWPITASLDGIANDGANNEWNLGADKDNVFPDVEMMIGTAGPDTMIGSDGDEIFIGNGKGDSLVGGGGSDYLDGGQDNDTIVGGPGADTLIGGVGADHFVSDADDLVQDYPISLDSYGTLRIEADAGNNTVLVRTKPGSVDQIEVMLDNITVEYAKADVDFVMASGGEGDDRIEIESSLNLNSSLFGEVGNDTLIGSAGRDTLNGADGDDSLIGNAGDDSITPGLGSDAIDGGDGNDSLNYQQHGSALNKAAGQRRITSANGEADSYSAMETLFCGSGDDTIFLDADDSLHFVNGVGGNDSLVGSPASDTILGGDGNDTIIGNGGVDSLDGGAGVNVVTDGVFVPAPDPVTLSGSVLRIIGTDAAETIVVRPDPGDLSKIEVSFGGVLSSFDASKVASIYVSSLGGNDQIDLSAMGIIARIYAGDGNDTIHGSAAADRIYAGEGNDLINSFNGSNVIYAEIGADTVYGGGHSDRVYAGDGNDWISGGKGNDILYGETGDDRIFGGFGNDYLVGGGGTDVIRGEAGTDRIVADSLLDDLRNNRGDVLMDEKAP